MVRGFLARELARAPRFEGLCDERSRESRVGEDEPMLLEHIDDTPTGPSPRDLAFFEHDGIEPDFEAPQRKRESFSELEELLREESPAKRSRPAPTKTPGPLSSMFQSLVLTPRDRSDVPPTSRFSQTRGKTDSTRAGKRQRAKERKNTRTLRQATLTKYIPVRKVQSSGKTTSKGTRDDGVELQSYFPGLFTDSVAEGSSPVGSQHRETSRSLLPDDFVLSIKLEPAEERLLMRFKYMFEAAVKKLSHAPPFPVGLLPFQSSMLEVQLDSTTSHSEHLILQQAIWAGRSAAHIYFGETMKCSPETPEWAKLPDSLPGTFLEKLAEFIRQKSILIVVPGASLNDLCRLSEKLRSRRVPTKYTTERIPWGRVKSPETWLVNYDNLSGDEARVCFDGVILPKGSPKWSGHSCGVLQIDVDPEYSELVPVRTVFVDCRLGALIKRLEKTDRLSTDGKVLGRYGVDLCSGDFGIIFSHENFTESSNTEIFTRLIRRVLRAANVFRNLVILRVNAHEFPDRLEKMIRFVGTRGVQSECHIQLLDTLDIPVQNTIQDLCCLRGDDLADFAFLTLRNCLLASLIDEENLDRNPHATLISALL